MKLETLKCGMNALYPVRQSKLNIACFEVQGSLPLKKVISIVSINANHAPYGCKGP